jgi:hypothetical protein
MLRAIAQKIAAEIGRRHHLKFEQNEHGRDGVTRDGKLWSGASVPGK